VLDRIPLPGAWAGQGYEYGAAPGGGDGVAIKMTSASAGPAYSYINVLMPAGVQVEDVTALSVRTYYESGSCGGGAPRFQLSVDTDGDGAVNGRVFVYLGPAPSFSGCAGGAWSSNDMLDGALRFDSTQVGGPFYGTQAQAQAAAGAAHAVVSVTLAVDSYWVGGNDPQVVWVDDVTVNCFQLTGPLDSIVTIVEGVTGLCL
jgi:hypothetical protein